MRIFPHFKYRECDAFAEYLHQQSLKGWHFVEWRLGLVFEKGEPADIRYAVEIFPSGKRRCRSHCKCERTAGECAKGRKTAERLVHNICRISLSEYMVEILEDGF